LLISIICGRILQMFSSGQKRIMPIRLTFIVFAILIWAIAAAADGGNARKVDPPIPSGFLILKGKPQAPKTQFSNSKMAVTSIKSFKGKIVILNLWATWCAPCIKEMPSLEKLAALLPQDKFRVIAVSQDRGGASVAKPFLDRIGIKKLDLYYDPTRRLSRDLGVRGLPTTIIIANDGTIVSRLEGVAEWDTKEVIEFLISLSDS
jgi:thiol-disulfide isomerase/thioredoxin